MLRWYAHYLVVLVVFASLATSALPLGVAQAQSSNLVWKPYLQQVTDSSAIVLWATRSGGTPTVAYGGTTSYGATASGSTRTLGALGYRLHRVKLDNLWPNTTYFYSARTDGAQLLPDETLKFTTAPTPDSNTPVTFLAFGDFGTGSTAQRNLRDRMEREAFDFIVTTGDNVYSNGTYSEFDTRMFQIYGDLFSRGGLFPSIGNHDSYTDNAAPYLDLFDLPTNAWRSADAERYYSFDYGNVHVVVLDSNKLLDESDSSATNDMYDWLRADLRNSTQPWKVAVFHHPPYSTGNSHGSDSRARSKLVPILEQGGVQLVLNGHDHIYQRSKPLRGGQVTSVEQGGVTYIVSGAGGATAYGCSNASWVAVKFCSTGYGIYNRITADRDSMRIEAVRDTGAVLDDLTLRRAGSAPAPSPTPAPSSGTITLPGRVEAEAYRAGGAGTGYNDTTAGNAGGALRSDDVDIEPCSDGAGCYNVGWTEPGEWLAYDVNIATSGSYVFQARVATKYSGTSIHIEIDGKNVTGSMAVPNTGGWQTWTTIASTPATLQAGKHTLRIAWDTSHVNVNYVDAVAGAGGGGGSGTRSFTATADAQVSKDNASSNYGSAITMNVDGNPEYEGFVCFDVRGVSGTVQRATLRVYVTTNGSSNGPAVYGTDDDWSEKSVTWNTRPAHSGSATDNVGAIGTNAWVEYDVSALVGGNGSACFALVSDSGDAVLFSTREGSKPPQLVIES